MIFRHFRNILNRLDVSGSALRFPHSFLEIILSSVPTTIQFRIYHSKNVFQITKIAKAAIFQYGGWW